MTRTIARLSLVSLALLLALTTSGVALAQGRPTAEHRALASEAGVWDADSKFWMAPGANPLESKAVETNTMMGPFWLVSEYKSDLGGMAFQGRGQMGYDPASKKYIGTWVDTMSPYLSVMEGSKEGNVLTMMSKGRDPQTGEENISKMVSTYVDDDHKTFEMFGPVDGKEGEWWKMMEITYTRKK